MSYCRHYLSLCVHFPRIRNGSITLSEKPESGALREAFLDFKRTSLRLESQTIGIAKGYLKKLRQREFRCRLEGAWFR